MFLLRHQQEEVFLVMTAFHWRLRQSHLRIHQKRKMSVAGIPPNSPMAQVASCIWKALLGVDVGDVAQERLPVKERMR
jgi:hypothetical protein